MARAASITPRAVRDAAARGDLPGAVQVKAGPGPLQWRIPPGAAQAFLQRRAAAARVPAPVRFPPWDTDVDRAMERAVDRARITELELAVVTGERDALSARLADAYAEIERLRRRVRLLAAAVVDADEAARQDG